MLPSQVSTLSPRLTLSKTNEPPTSRIISQTHRRGRLRPFKTLRYLNRLLFKHRSQHTPINALVPRITIRRRLLIITDPIVRDDSRVIMTHDPLPQIINAVLVMPLVHIRHRLLRLRLLGKETQMVVLPEVVQAVDVVGTACDGHVAPRGRGDRSGEENGG